MKNTQTSLHKRISRPVVSVLLSMAILIGSVVCIMPAATFAAGSGYCSGYTTTFPGGQTTVGSTMKYVTCLLEVVGVPVLFSLAMLVFVVGAVRFMTSGESEKKNQGKQTMIWGIVAFVVLFGLWAIIGVLGNTFGVKNITPTIGNPGQIQP